MFISVPLKIGRALTWAYLTPSMSKKLTRRAPNIPQTNNDLTIIAFIRQRGPYRISLEVSLLEQRSKRCHADVHFMPSDDLSWGGGDKVSVSKLWRDSDLALFEVSKVWEALSLSEVWVYWAVEGERMSGVAISLKIFPSEVTVNPVLLMGKIGKSLLECASVYTFDGEPIAFGLTSLSRPSLSLRKIRLVGNVDGSEDLKPYIGT